MTASDIETCATEPGRPPSPCRSSDHPVGTVAGRRLLIDMDRCSGLGFTPDSDDILHEMCQSLRLRASVLPGGRAERSTVRWAIARQVIEEQAFTLGSRFGVLEIVDAALAERLDRLRDVREQRNEPSIIMTNPARLLRRRPGHLHRLARCLSQGRLRSSVARVPLRTASPVDPNANEVYDFGAGWVEPESGHRRCRNKVITLVFPEPGDVGRVDVRLVCPERVMRLRFRGLDDKAFKTFWSRWASDAEHGDESAASADPGH